MKSKMIDHFGFDHVINYKTTKDINQSVKKLAQMVLMSIMIMGGETDARY
jgi:hypothetical protein